MQRSMLYAKKKEFKIAVLQKLSELRENTERQTVQSGKICMIKMRNLTEDHGREPSRNSRAEKLSD